MMRLARPWSIGPLEDFRPHGDILYFK